MRTIKFGKPIIEAEEKNAVMAVLEGDILVHGPKAKEFEQLFSEYTGSPALTLIPVSSSISLSAACLRVSSNSTLPPGIAQTPFAGAFPLFTSNIFSDP